jgi:hypothetical protein
MEGRVELAGIGQVRVDRGMRGDTARVGVETVLGTRWLTAHDLRVLAQRLDALREEA